MKRFIVLAVFCLPATLRAQPLTITAHITDTDSVLMLVRGYDWCDTLLTANGRLHLRKTLEFPQLLTIVFVKGSQSIAAISAGNERGMRSRSDGHFREVFAEKGDISINTGFAGIPSASIRQTFFSGQALFEQFRKRFHPLVQVARTVIDSSYTAKKSSPESKLYTMIYDRILQVEQEVAAMFVKENAGSPVAAYVLYRYGRTDNVMDLSALYQLFPVGQRTNGYLENIRQKLTALRATQELGVAPAFTTPDINGKPFSLPDQRGKYVVLDFWGTWCKPCIDGMPDMKRYQEKYSTKALFAGIACNDTEAAVRAAIITYGIKGLQILNGKGASDISSLYSIEGYPTKIIIDPEGKLIYRAVGENSSFYKKLDELLLNR